VQRSAPSLGGGADQFAGEPRGRDRPPLAAHRHPAGHPLQLHLQGRTQHQDFYCPPHGQAFRLVPSKYKLRTILFKRKSSLFFWM
jgi:hypothetical protein